MTLSDPNPCFKVTINIQVEYLWSSPKADSGLRGPTTEKDQPQNIVGIHFIYCTSEDIMEHADHT